MTTTTNRRSHAVASLILGLALAAPAAATILENGVAVDGLALQAGEGQRFVIELPAGASDLEISTTGGSGDVDLYVSFDYKPSLRAYDCGPEKAGNEETCTFPAPEVGTYHIRIYGFETFSGVTLLATYQGGDNGGTTLAGPVVSRKSAPNDQNVVYAMWRQILEIDAACSSERGTFVLQAQALAKIQHEMDFDDILVLCLSDSPNPADCDDDPGASYSKWEIDREQPDIASIVKTVDLQHLETVSDCDGSRTFYLNAVMEEDNNGADEILAFGNYENTGIIATFFPR